jgi:small subunit ribosomal protein S13
MARIAGVDIPDKKRGEIALTYIYGIGRSTAQTILDKAGISRDKKAVEWNDDEASAIRTIIGNEFKTEGALRSEVQLQTENRKLKTIYTDRQSALSTGHRATFRA